MNDTPLITIEQSFVLRLSIGEAGALLGSLDRSAIAGTPVARIYDALADATRYSQRVPKITPLSPPAAGMPGDERGFFRSLEQNIGCPVQDMTGREWDPLAPWTASACFIDDSLS